MAHVHGVECTSYQPNHPIQERALSMIQRSVLMGSLAVLASGVIGWQITKWYMGVKNAKVSQLPPCSRPLRLRTRSWRGVARCVTRYGAACARRGAVWRGGVVWCGVVMARPL